MSQIARLRLASLASLLLAGAAQASPAPHTAAAVIAADDAWLQAEIHGDAVTLSALLEPGYVTVGVDGKATTRDVLIAAAAKRGDQPSRAEQVRAWKASHPTRPSVGIFGDTAVLTWVVIRQDGAAPVSSCDVFVYRAGAWRAIYSQHSSASA